MSDHDAPYLDVVWRPDPGMTARETLLAVRCSTDLIRWLSESPTMVVQAALRLQERLN